MSLDSHPTPAHTRADSAWSGLQTLTIDPRSLGLARIVLGILLGIHAIGHLRLYSDLDSPSGILPSVLLPQSQEIPYFPSLLSWLERFSWGFPVFAILTAVSYLAFTIGWKTRLATVATLVAFSTICHRNPYLVIGSDELIGSLLLWSCLLPLGSKFSVDACKSSKQASPNQRVMSGSVLASFGLLLQLSIVYFATAWQKNGATWWAEGTALNRILGMTTFRLPGASLLEWLPTESLPYLTRAILLSEYAIPVLILCPIWQPTCRRLAIVGILFLHLGIALTIDTGLFSLTMLASIPFLLSPGDWQNMATIERWFRSSPNGDDDPVPIAPPKMTRHWLLEVCAAFLFLGFIQENWNRTFAPPGFAVSNSVIALPWRFAAAAQRWTMFAPDPPVHDPHITVRIRFQNGQVADVWDNQSTDPQRALNAPDRTEFLWKLFMLKGAMLLFGERANEGAQLRRTICEFFARDYVARFSEKPGTHSSAEPQTFEQMEMWVTFVPTNSHNASERSPETVCVARYKLKDLKVN